MADFSFLNVSPGGPDVEDDEETNSQNQAFEASHAAAHQTPTTFNLDSEGSAGDFQQKRAKAADFAKKQTLNSLDQLANAHAANYQQMAQTGGEEAVSGIAPLDYEGTKQRIFSTTPENYAQVLYNEAKKHSLPEDQIAGIMRPSEDAVTQYKQLQMENQAPNQQIQQAMKPGDVANAKAQLASLNNTIEQTTQKMALSATSRQRDELMRALDFYNSQKRVLQSKIPAEPEQGGIEGGQNTIDHALTASGEPRHDFIQSLTETRRMVEKEGIPTSSPVTPLSFIPTYINLVSHIFNPQVRDKMLGELAPPPQQEGGVAQQPQEGGEQKSAFGSDKLEQDPRFQHNQQMIAQNENRHQQIIQQLANSGTFKNVGDVLGFVMTSFLLGPKVASLFFSNMLQNGNLRGELDRLDHESNQMYHQQNSYIQLAQHARAQAAQERHGQIQAAEQHRHNIQMESYYRMKTGNKAAFTPEEKQTDLALQHSYRFQSGNLDAQAKKVASLEKVLDRGPIDPDFKNAQGAINKERVKLGTMQNDFAAWKSKVADWYQRHGASDVNPGGTNANDITAP